MNLTKYEIGAIGIFLAVIVAATGLNLQNSFRKGRDAQRLGDVQTVANALEVYFTDVGEYPPSNNGRIVACGSILTPTVCEWGDIFFEQYLRNLPRDPFFNTGGSYTYISDGKRYQLYASLESVGEPEFNQSIVKRNIQCGNKICNFGRASGQTPLDKTLAEYENELIEAAKRKK